MMHAWAGGRLDKKSILGRKVASVGLESQSGVVHQNFSGPGGELVCSVLGALIKYLHQQDRTIENSPDTQVPSPI